jgi:hypothetical protein
MRGFRYDQSKIEHANVVNPEFQQAKDVRFATVPIIAGIGRCEGLR